MYVKGRRKGTVKFVIQPGGSVREVAVAGDFSKWRPVPMKKESPGTYVGVVSGVAGTFEYKFIVDGQWLTDPDHSSWAMSPLGTSNSVGVLE